VPRHGFINVHGSLLPRWRGAAPIQRGLLAGDSEFGVTVQCVAKQMDAGDVLLAESVIAEAGDNLGTLEARLEPLGAGLLVQAVAQFAGGEVRRVAQDEALVTFAPAIKDTEALIDWSQPAERIVRQVRAFNPRPVAWTSFSGGRLNVFEAAVAAAGGSEPGVIMAVTRQGPVVSAGEGAVTLREIQAAGCKRMNGRDWANGVRLAVGSRFNEKAVTNR